MRYEGMITGHGSFPWWVVMMEGIAAVILGLLMLFSPAMTVVVLVQVLGFYWLISGILALVSLFEDRSQWGWKLVAGILGLLAGLIVIRHPLWSAVLLPAILVIWLAVFAIIRGISEFIYAFGGGGFWMAVIGIVNVVIGVFLLFYPLSGALALTIILGIVAVVGGIITFFGSFRMRNQQVGMGTQPPPMSQPI